MRTHGKTGNELRFRKLQGLNRAFDFLTDGQASLQKLPRGLLQSRQTIEKVYSLRKDFIEVNQPKDPTPSFLHVP